MAHAGLEGVSVRGAVTREYGAILTPDALAFVAGLARRHTETVHELLARRNAVQARYDAGGRPHFLPQTKHVRDWSLLQGQGSVSGLAAAPRLSRSQHRRHAKQRGSTSIQPANPLCTRLPCACNLPKRSRRPIGS